MEIDLRQAQRSTALAFDDVAFAEMRSAGVHGALQGTACGGL